jgi:alkaline phosphatase
MAAVASAAAMVALAPAGGTAQTQAAQTQAAEPERGSAIFIHPDGAGVAAWSAARLLLAGPDGTLAWDRLERIGVYRGHMSDAIAASSNGGATAHAFGVKAPYASYGLGSPEPLASLSGKPHSVLVEAHRAGLATALVNSGHIAEPGTGVFGASAPSRQDVESITLQLIEGGTDIILSGGEVLLLPTGVRGRHRAPGLRSDGRNLIDRARELGYRVVYTREELAALPDDTRRVLGVFAAGHTFNDYPEEALRSLGYPLYNPDAPTVAEMTAAALRFLEADGRRFLLVAEEEGSDNFANANNARGMLTALARADSAYAVALDFIERNPNTLLITTADSDAGGPEVYPVNDTAAARTPLPATTANGAPLDGHAGTETAPFIARPDRNGRSHAFGIAWAGRADMMGGIVARAHGLNADRLPASVDNTDIYRMLYATLFGRWLP